MISSNSILKILASSSIIALMTGCASCCSNYCEEHPVIKTVYLKQTLPPLPKDPEFVPYSVNSIVLNGEELYTLTKGDAAIMAANWIEFRDYSKKIKNQYHLLDVNETINTK